MKTVQSTPLLSTQDLPHVRNAPQVTKDQVLLGVPRATLGATYVSRVHTKTKQDKVRANHAPENNTKILRVKQGARPALRHAIHKLNMSPKVVPVKPIDNVLRAHVPMGHVKVTKTHVTLTRVIQDMREQIVTNVQRDMVAMEAHAPSAQTPRTMM